MNWQAESALLILQRKLEAASELRVGISLALDVVMKVSSIEQALYDIKALETHYRAIEADLEGQIDKLAKRIPGIDG